MCNCNRLYHDYLLQKNIGSKIIYFYCQLLVASLYFLASYIILPLTLFCHQRCLPFCAVTTGHIINLPVIRYKEITTGIPIYMKDKTEPFMKSKVAAVKSICECLVSRIAMSIPCFLLIPIITQKLMPYCFSQHRPWILIPIQTGLCAIG